MDQGKKTSQNTALVVGANGIIGRNLTEYLVGTENWSVIAVSRTPLAFESSVHSLALDLTNPHVFSQHTETLKDVTHVFFAAYVQKNSLAEQTSANLNIMKNLVEGVERIAKRLQRVLFIQGGKAYGAHLGQFKTPAKETDPRHFPPNFYYSQEDYLRGRSRGKSWCFTAIRPDIVDGVAVGNPMNIANIIAAYASLCRELKVAFRFPGPIEAYNALVNITGADVLAKSLEWAALSEKCKGEIFNITNGDVFRWSEAWPKIASYFHVEMAEPLTFSLAEYMADKGPIWHEMAQNFGLKTEKLEHFVQWDFGDFVFSNRHDAFFDVNKARRFGFQEMHVDTVEHLLGTFQKMRSLRLIP